VSEELDFLKGLGAQKIFEDTHISLRNAQSVIHESFEGLTKVQFLGFISILEREYELNLSDLKAKGLAYFSDDTFKIEQHSSVFIETKRAKKPTLIYILIALLVFVIVAYISIGDSESVESPETIDNTTIESVQKNLAPLIVDENLSSTTKEEELLEEEKIKEKKVAEVIPSLKIIAKSKLWIGYVDRQEDIKKQTIIKKNLELELDPKKEWLLSLGHGNVDIIINDEIQEFKTTKNIRFLYKDGELKKLTLRDFKILNEGRVW